MVREYLSYDNCIFKCNNFEVSVHLELVYLSLEQSQEWKLDGWIIEVSDVMLILSWD